VSKEVCHDRTSPSNTFTVPSGLTLMGAVGDAGALFGNLLEDLDPPSSTISWQPFTLLTFQINSLQRRGLRCAAYCGISVIQMLPVISP